MVGVGVAGVGDENQGWFKGFNNCLQVVNDIGTGIILAGLISTGIGIVSKLGSLRSIGFGGIIVFIKHCC